MRDPILLLLSAFAFCSFSCGGDQAPPMLDYYGGTGGAAPSGFCSTYCNTVQAGTGCATYSQCGNVCGWYQNTVCFNDYSAFASCITGASSISCQVVTTTGKTALNVPSSCGTQLTTFRNCIAVNNVDVCPYGS
jgi:hypothetical protein